MSNLNFTFNGISSAQGNAYIAFLEANSSTFRSLEQTVAQNGISTVEINFGTNTTNETGLDDPNGNPTYLGSLSYQSPLQPQIWHINLNTQALYGYAEGNGFYIEPVEILIAHELAHASAVTDINPFTGKSVFGSSEPEVIAIQNQNFFGDQR